MANFGILTIGNFDGVHIGHQHIIHQVLSLARKKKVPAILYTFDPHPREILKKQKQRYRLCRIKQTLKLLKKLGLDYVIIEAFTPAFSKLSPTEFITERIVSIIRPQTCILGKNFRFGKGGTGDVELLKELSKKYHFNVEITSALKKNGKIISSSLIREAILDGKWQEAQQLLGRAFSIQAPVVKGDGRGKSLGCPTINLKPSPEQILAKNGVYAARVKVPPPINYLPAVVNIGFCPTFFTKKEHKIEVHIIEKSLTWQNSECEVEIHHRIRSERAFPSADLLVKQMKQDIQQAKSYLDSDTFNR